MDPGILVPPKGYGGHERLVDMFAKEYVKMGHEVHLLVTSGSNVEGCVMHPFGRAGFPSKKWVARKAILVAWYFLYKRRNEFDLIHNFGRLVYLIPVLNTHIKKIMTYGREISSRNILLINKLPNRNLIFTGCSQNLISRVVLSGKWKAVYNAIEFKKFDIQIELKENAPLIFLGRIERIKGAHTAIKVAKATGNKLIIAGNISKLPEEIEYFNDQIKPHIDGINVDFVGEVNDVEKNILLGMAKALLMPIEWNEPFGIVMIEAIACGTPVIAFRRGSVPEVVENGITGFIVEDDEEMISKISMIDSINRINCAARGKDRFDVSVIANEYLNLI